MHSTGREEWKRIASLVLVAVIATFSLPVGASALTHSVDATPAQRAQVKRLTVEARPVASRRTLTQRETILSAGPYLVAALTLVGILLVVRTLRPGWTPGLLPVQRGPPSYALNHSVLR
ncbi:MAG: hypothetical protein JWO77_2786 [Ilumatobacteraceae bacterium]|nr:hypothetical protein [Ilumatobacteraceae bacterium]